MDLGRAPAVKNTDVASVSRSLRIARWAVGENGTILRTENGGKSWTKQDSWKFEKMGFEIVSIASVVSTSNSGWAVKDNGTILRTEDGGIKWIT